MEQGLKAAHDGMPPNRLYAWFGSDEELKPKGFLMTKVSGLTVLASHFGLRGAQPSNQDIQRILNEETMLVSITFYGDTSTFAKDSYVVLEQGDRLIKPVTVRFDAVAHRTLSLICTVAHPAAAGICTIPCAMPRRCRWRAAL